MSTAQKFAFKQPFPSCLQPVESPNFVSYVGGLTLNQLMGFFWNLETYTLTTSFSGTMTKPNAVPWNASMNGSITISPFATTGDWSSMDTFETTPSFSQFFTTTPGYGAVSKQPRDRVCNNTMGSFRCGTGSVIGKPAALLSFYPRIDPNNNANYAILYDIFLDQRSDVHNSDSLSIQMSPNYNGSGRLVNNGTFAICGIDFPYYATSRNSAGTTIVTVSGGTLSSNSSQYTY